MYGEKEANNSRAFFPHWIELLGTRVSVNQRDF
jgi:hypothetical protein